MESLPTSLLGSNSAHISLWTAAFSREQITLLQHEKMLTSPQSHLQSFATVLGLPTIALPKVLPHLNTQQKHGKTGVISCRTL